MNAWQGTCWRLTKWFTEWVEANIVHGTAVAGKLI